MSEKRAIGVIVGYILAQELSKGMKPVYIGEHRVHHYLLALGALFTDDEFLQGVFLGAGIEDLPDLINDLHPDLKNLANNLRKFQGKTPHLKSFGMVISFAQQQYNSPAFIIFVMFWQQSVLYIFTAFPPSKSSRDCHYSETFSNV